MHSPAVDIDKGNSEDDEERRKRKRQSTSKWRDKKKRFNRDGKLEWSVYKIGSPISNSTGELELFDFIQRLENISTLATTKQDRIARLLEHTATKLDLLDKLRCELIGCPPDDIILVSDTESFEAALAKSFQVPILYRPATSSEQFGIRQLLRHLAENEHASVEVYDYSIEDSSKRTRKSSVHELLSCFQPENSHQPALNFLDIENRTKIPFCPPSITLQDVRTKIETQTQDSIGKIGSEWTGEQLKESFLLSKKGAISPIHVDTFASITWIRLLDGQKIWYYPPKVTPQTLRWLARSGSQVPEHYEGGWVKVVLRPADILVLPPSFPHAVFSSEDSLAVCGHIYTTGTLGWTLEGLKIQEDYPDISNEDLYDDAYGTLARILRECGAVATQDEKAKIVSNCSLFPLPRSAVRKKGGTPAREEFLDAVQNFITEWRLSA